VRQANLPVLGMAPLRAVEVRHPARRLMPIEHLSDDGSAAAATDDTDHHLAVLKHPIPAGAAGHAHARLVRANHARTAQPGEDAGYVSVEVPLAPMERSVQCTPADRQDKQLQQQSAQPLVADRVHEA